MDDRIIDFNEIKNKANEKDVDKLENYMYLCLENRNMNSKKCCIYLFNPITAA